MATAVVESKQLPVQVQQQQQQQQVALGLGVQPQLQEAKCETNALLQNAPDPGNAELKTLRMFEGQEDGKTLFDEGKMLLEGLTGNAPRPGAYFRFLNQELSAYLDGKQQAVVKDLVAGLGQALTERARSITVPEVKAPTVVYNLVTLRDVSAAARDYYDALVADNGPIWTWLNSPETIQTLVSLEESQREERKRLGFPPEKGVDMTDRNNRQAWIGGQVALWEAAEKAQQAALQAATTQQPQKYVPPKFKGKQVIPDNIFDAIDASNAATTVWRDRLGPDEKRQGKEEAAGVPDNRVDPYTGVRIDADAPQVGARVLDLTGRNASPQQVVAALQQLLSKAKNPSLFALSWPRLWARMTKPKFDANSLVGTLQAAVLGMQNIYRNFPTVVQAVINSVQPQKPAGPTPTDLIQSYLLTVVGPTLTSLQGGQLQQAADAWFERTTVIAIVAANRGRFVRDQTLRWQVGLLRLLPDNPVSDAKLRDIDRFLALQDLRNAVNQSLGVLAPVENVLRTGDGGGFGGPGGGGGTPLDITCTKEGCSVAPTGSQAAMLSSYF